MTVLEVYDFKSIGDETSFSENKFQHPSIPEAEFDWEQLAVELKNMGTSSSAVTEVPTNTYFPDSDITSRMETLLSCIQRLQVQIPESSKVRNYLVSHLSLASKLPNICLSANCEFGNDSKISLEIYKDPEIDDEHLKVYIHQENYDKPLRTRIRQTSKITNKLIKGMSGWIHLTYKKLKV